MNKCKLNIIILDVNAHGDNSNIPYFIFYNFFFFVRSSFLFLGFFLPFFHLFGLSTSLRAWKGRKEQFLTDSPHDATIFPSSVSLIFLFQYCCCCLSDGRNVFSSFSVPLMCLDWLSISHSFGICRCLATGEEAKKRATDLHRLFHLKRTCNVLSLLPPSKIEVP